ncbi:DUF6457 domain-containing protein [Gandjariella thermophila]|uniref:DUF6457 domain-containing protein n=1 Tax=Gandjariella thermophila TaxID=1931992 RepID=A0A4D4IZJ1_9PSEU|nr:DUF6457 domain-containing protein [Gandjariella thermophila]GDY29671.1 hypothetical protein GTS_13040 [Gandjariella thermophila]
MSVLDDWTRRVAEELALDPAVLDQTAVLDVARDVAHAVARPAAPLTAYLLGVAVGRGADPATAAAEIGRLARDWAGRAENSG